MDATKDELREAFMAGFRQSGEGWNYEILAGNYETVVEPKFEAWYDTVGG